MLDALLGNASQMTIESLEKEFSEFVTDNEEIQVGYKVLRDQFIFTNKRLIMVDKQGMTGKKVEYFSIPYSKITMFSIESAGHLDRDAELKIWVSGHGAPLEKKFNKQIDIYEVERVLASYVL